MTKTLTGSPLGSKKKEGLEEKKRGRSPQQARSRGTYQGRKDDYGARPIGGARGPGQKRKGGFVFSILRKDCGPAKTALPCDRPKEKTLQKTKSTLHLHGKKSPKEKFQDMKSAVEFRNRKKESPCNVRER